MIGGEIYRKSQRSCKKSQEGKVAGWEVVGTSMPSSVDNYIERDTIISANVIVGRGDSSITVAKHYRVVDVHDKYYNKWFMSKVPSNKWKKDSKFKAKARMQEINAVQEYEDVNLHYTFYRKGSVSQIVTDEEVMNIIGQLKRV